MLEEFVIMEVLYTLNESSVFKLICGIVNIYVKEEISRYFPDILFPDLRFPPQFFPSF